MRKKPNLAPRMEKCARVLVSEPAGQRGCWRELCPQAKELWLEVGCGKGKFTVETAQQSPDALIVGLEKVPDAMVMAMESVMELGLTNVVFIDADAAQVDEFFAPGEADRIYINFCDPWPSSKHAKRRLTAPGFLAKYISALKPNGEIHFKTDNQDLFTYSLFQFKKMGFELLEVTRDLHADGPVGVMTGYEERFYAQGLPICRLVARVLSKSTMLEEEIE